MKASSARSATRLEPPEALGQDGDQVGTCCHGRDATCATDRGTGHDAGHGVLRTGAAGTASRAPARRCPPGSAHASALRGVAGDEHEAAGERRRARVHAAVELARRRPRACACRRRSGRSARCCDALEAGAAAAWPRRPRQPRSSSSVTTRSSTLGSSSTTRATRAVSLAGGRARRRLAGAARRRGVTGSSTREDRLARAALHAEAAAVLLDDAVGDATGRARCRCRPSSS